MASTCYDQHIYQIWSLYLQSPPTIEIWYERRYKISKMGWFEVVREVVRGHSRSLENSAILTAWRYASLVYVCRHVSVHLSVTRRYCIKTAKRKITQTVSYDSLRTLVFWCQISISAKFQRVTPNGGIKQRWGGSDSVLFKYMLLSYLEWPLTTPNNPIFLHFVSPIISTWWLEIATSNLVDMLIVASAGQRMANHP